MTSFSIVRVSVTMLAVALALALLAFADGSMRDVHQDQLPLTLLAVTFVALSVVLALSTLSDRLQLGLQMMAIYFAIYLVLPGYRHMSVNTFPFFALHYPIWARVQASVVVMAFVASVLAGYGVTFVQERPYARMAAIRGRARIRANIVLATVLLLLAVASAAVFLSAVGLSGAFQTRAEVATKASGTASLGFVRTLPRAVTFLSFLYAAIQYRFGSQRTVALVFTALNLPIFLTVNWPFALARFALFGYLLMFVVLVTDVRKLTTRVAMTGGFVVGALGLMPIIDRVTRRGQSFDQAIVDDFLGRYFDTGDFDGLQSTINAVLYVADRGMQNGRQILSSILFFVPRAIWPGKGEPTGSITAEAAGYAFTNISQPLPSEFYVDFAMPGVIIGGLLVGFALSRIDRWIDANWDGGPAARVIAGLVVAYSIIVYRGALLGIISAVSVVTVGGLLILRFGLTPAAPRQPANARAAAAFPRTGPAAAGSG